MMTRLLVGALLVCATLGALLLPTASATITCAGPPGPGPLQPLLEEEYAACTALAGCLDGGPGPCLPPPPQGA